MIYRAYIKRLLHDILESTISCRYSLWFYSWPLPCVFHPRCSFGENVHCFENGRFDGDRRIISIRRNKYVFCLSRTDEENPANAARKHIFAHNTMTFPSLSHSSLHLSTKWTDSHRCSLTRSNGPRRRPIGYKVSISLCLASLSPSSIFSPPFPLSLPCSHCVLHSFSGLSGSNSDIPSGARSQWDTPTTG